MFKIMKREFKLEMVPVYDSFEAELAMVEWSIIDGVIHFRSFEYSESFGYEYPYFPSDKENDTVTEQIALSEFEEILNQNMSSEENWIPYQPKVNIFLDFGFIPVSSKDTVKQQEEILQRAIFDAQLKELSEAKEIKPINSFVELISQATEQLRDVETGELNSMLTYSLRVSKLYGAVKDKIPQLVKEIEGEQEKEMEI